MSEENTVQVNFGRPMPLFPLGEVALFPQQFLPLHIFEPRYRQLVQQVLDGSGQFAMAVFAGQSWKQQYHGRPPLRSAVCIGQIVQHDKLPDGRFHLLLQGICRGRIARELPPDDEKLYREAILEPVGVELPSLESLSEVRDRLGDLLSVGPLTQLRNAKPVAEHLRNPEIPTVALLELVSFAILSGVCGPETRYKLLAEGDVMERVHVIEEELGQLSRILERASVQRPQDWPKGCSWN